MVRHFVYGLTCLATIATLSGCSSSARNAAGSDSIETTAPDQPDKSVGDSIGDATLTASVKLGLAFGRGVKGSNITVHTDHGIVTLTGQVDSEAERQLAARITREIEGVQDVVNRLEVRG